LYQVPEQELVGVELDVVHVPFVTVLLDDLQTKRL
jgi:hypothetical protein